MNTTKKELYTQGELKKTTIKELYETKNGKMIPRFIYDKNVSLPRTQLEGAVPSHVKASAKEASKKKRLQLEKILTHYMIFLRNFILAINFVLLKFHTRDQYLAALNR